MGGTLGLWLGVYGVNQSNVQRYVSCRTVKEASKAVWINCFALIMINFTAASSGLVMFAYYNGCDPMKAGWIKVRAPYFFYISDWAILEDSQIKSILGKRSISSIHGFG